MYFLDKGISLTEQGYEFDYDIKQKILFISSEREKIRKQNENN